MIIIPKSIRDVIYRWVGSNRYVWFGRKESCRMPTAAEKERFLSLDYPL
jgi:predicted DCC family thiol-disulfide oxidoreductase YuxK